MDGVRRDDSGPGRFTNRNVTVQSLIRNTYGPIEVNRLRGVSDWMRRDRFDIVATTPNGLLPSRQMLRFLLEDYFGLRVRWETQALPYYALETVGSAKDSTMAMTAAAIEDCDAYREEERKRRERNGPPTAVPTGPHCGNRLFVDSSGTWTWRIGAMTMAGFAQELSWESEHPVRDETGIVGRFDFEFSFFDPSWGFDANGQETGPSRFAALEEQLGLKLRLRRGPVETLVITHAERPVPD